MTPAERVKDALESCSEMLCDCGYFSNGDSIPCKGTCAPEKAKAALPALAALVKELAEAKAWANCQHGISRRFKCADCHDPKDEIESLKACVKNASARAEQGEARLEAIKKHLEAHDSLYLYEEALGECK